MKTWNTPELTVLNISETAKTEICNITGSVCINATNSASANSYGQCKKCPIFQASNNSGTDMGTTDSDITSRLS